MTLNPRPIPAQTDLDLAGRFASWALAYQPDPPDELLADRSLKDTLSVAAAARGHHEVPLTAMLGPAGRLAALAHLIDYDDLHIPSTTHISAVCAAAALATGGGARAYLAGAGVMARLGTMLGWRHYDAGWHATCSAGAPAAAVTAAVAMGLDAATIRVAIALAVPGAGGVNRAFGTSAKSLQVGFAVDAGVRAAQLAAAGATADGGALSQWLGLVGGTEADAPDTPAIPGGLAVKAYPCCYAMQRPIAATLEALNGERPAALDIQEIIVSTPLVTLRPLIHARPQTGLQGKFSLQYAIAAAILDGTPGLASFTDAAVTRKAAQTLIERVRLETTPGGNDLLEGTTEVELRLAGGNRYIARVMTPPGAPGQPLGADDLARKAEDCAGPHDASEILTTDWSSARLLVNRWFEQ
jgi:2-methylcitrate dehydratase PrpD